MKTIDVACPDCGETRVLNTWSDLEAERTIKRCFHCAHKARRGQAPGTMTDAVARAVNEVLTYGVSASEAARHFGCSGNSVAKIVAKTRKSVET